MFRTYRRMRDVFPTAFSPRRHIFDLRCFMSVIMAATGGASDRGPVRRWAYLTVPRRFSGLSLRQVGHAGAGEHECPEAAKDVLDASARLRGRVVVRRVERADRLRDLAVPVQDRRLVLEVHLVDRVHDRDLAHDAEDVLHPVVELLEGRVARQVGHREDALRPVEVRVLEEVPERLLAHDVPDRHVHVVRGRAVPRHELLLAFRHLRAEGRDVAIVELVVDKAAHEAGLPDGRLADEAHLRLDALDFRHGGNGRRCLGWLYNDGAVVLGREEAFLRPRSYGRAMRLEHRVVLALDVVDPTKARSVARAVRGSVDAVKVGWPLVLAAGLGIVKELAADAGVVCDFKVAGIPNTNRLILEQAVAPRPS